MNEPIWPESVFFSLPNAGPIEKPKEIEGVLKQIWVDGASKDLPMSPYPLNLLQKAKGKRDSIKQLRKAAGWENAQLLKILAQI